MFNKFQYNGKEKRKMTWGWGVGDGGLLISFILFHSIFISHFNLNTQCLGLNQGRFNDGISVQKLSFNVLKTNRKWHYINLSSERKESGRLVSMYLLDTTRNSLFKNLCTPFSISSSSRCFLGIPFT